MGKSKKIKNEDSECSGDEGTKETKVEKKSKKSRKRDQDLEEAQLEMEKLTLGEDLEENIEVDLKSNKGSKKKSKANKKTIIENNGNGEKGDNSEDDEEEEKIPKSKSKNRPGGFELLMQSDSDSEEDISVEAPKSKKSAFQMLVDDSDEDNEEPLSSDEEKAEIIEKPEPKTKVKKKKKKKDVGINEDIDKLDTKVDEDGFLIVEEDEAAKLAAQKKKEKKARKKNKATVVEESNTKPSDEDEAPPVEENDEDDKKKKKKKKKPKEEEDKKKKKPTKGTLLAMQEALKKVQEDEERQQKEEEERIAREEAAEAERLEKKRLEEERKIAKKERERARKEQLRKEGKLLTVKQKQQQAQRKAMLEAMMKAQGIPIPVAGEKKGPRPGTRVRPKKNIKAPQEEVVQPKEETPIEVVETKEIPEPIEEAKDNVKDAWDATSSEDEEPKKEEPVEVTVKTSEEKVVKVKAEVGKEESDSESSEDDDSDEETDSEDDDSDEDDSESAQKQSAALRIQKRRMENEEKRTTDVLRSPVVCVLGHVDTGKTKILDKLRRTNVQDGEAGGITQQIGATNVPIEVIKEQCKNVKDFSDLTLKLPGLLIIDTPGHESFSNLRDRGSSLCDIAILVVDIMHNLEPQTIESINLLKKKRTPFIVALNKIDRIYEWRSNRHKDIQDVVESQQPNVKLEFNKRAREVITALAEQGLNASLFWETPDPKTYINIVPTSAFSGEGMGNLMGLLVKLSQSMLAKRLSFSEELQATVLEVKAIPGLGTTIDIVLVNGTLKEGSTMIVAGTSGPIVTHVKALLTPSKMQDLRVKVPYIEHKEIRAAQGVKISAKELEKAIAGLNLLVAHQPDEIDVCKREIQRGLDSALNSIKLKDEGVFVQASTLGSLEALLEFLRTSKIPYAGVKIGPVVKRDVMKASVMLEREPKYTVILAFDVKVERDAQEMANSINVKIFQADIIYHLFDRFTDYQEKLLQEKREFYKDIAIFPCTIKILPNFVFNSRDPIVAGFEIEAGVVRPGTPLCCPIDEGFLDIGVVTSIQVNHKEVESARKGDSVCIKIEPIPGESPKMFGRHFNENNSIVSKISRASIDACKNYFRDDLQKADWKLMVQLKKIFGIF